MLRSLRSRLILASLLWTTGLLMLMHMASLVMMHVFPSVRKVNALGPIVAGVVFMVAGIVGALRGLSPFRLLREKLSAIRMGQDRRVEGEYPSEIQPLVDELNALLEDREKAVKRAFATAGDLAHSLKTPLALLAQETDRTAIAQQVERMSRQVDYHLARARAAASGASGAARCLVAPCASALVRTLLKLHAGKAIEISSTMDAELFVRVQREDLDEMLGNLLDNACKWAKSKVLIEAVLDGTMLVMTVHDDGPGLPYELRSVVLERGVRIDEATPGSGLGLAIVRDLSELYGGSISLDDSYLGGLAARVSLPV